MKSENQCEGLSELLKNIKKGAIIHITNKGNYFYFVEFRDKKMFFSIPNHITPQKPNIKSISEEQFCNLLKKLIEKKTLTKEDFPFQDCRKSAFYGFLHHLLAIKLQ